MKSSLPRKFMSLREKNGTAHRRSKSSEPNGPKNRPLSGEAFFSYFKSDAAKQAAREEKEKGDLAAQIDDLDSRLEALQLTGVTKDHIRYALQSEYAAGSPDKAIDLLRLHREAYAGAVLPYDPNVEMLGAENRCNVTCYLDALLFAMFAKLSAFECMLKNDLPEGPPSKLAAIVRLWVNMLRSGRLIHVDITEHLQNALADCGWPDARRIEMQDTSEAFAFITETLQLPLLTLQVDLFHQGRRDDDDHKVVYERLLNLAVPPDPEGKGVKLEDCLEDYFNTKVDVLRDSLVDKKPAEARSPTAESPAPFSRPASLREGSSSVFTQAHDDSPTDDTPTPASPTLAARPAALTSLDTAVDTTVKSEHTIRLVSPDGSQPDGQYTTESSDQGPAPLSRRWTMLESHTPGRDDNAGSSSFSDPRVSVNGRKRAATIIQRITLEEAKPANVEIANVENAGLLKQFKRQGSTIIKAVTIPAWQFFRLIPWHATSNSKPISDVEVARQFNKRPVVGICLKRYMMTNSGKFERQNTYIDIPDSLRLPYFMMAGSGQAEESSELSAEYKLVLQSVICHRGASLHSGHYISFARVNPKILTDNRRHEHDPPPDYEEEQWVKFDDLAVDNRVSYVEDIKDALKREMPYLLFYQIVPMVNVASSTSGDTEANEPPSYNDSTSNFGGTRTPNHERTDSDAAEAAMSNIGSSFLGPSLSAGSVTTGPSIRFSSDMDRPPRISLEEGSMVSSTVGGARRAGGRFSRRGSLAFTESVAGTPIVTPEGGRSPVVAPVVMPEETTAQRLSRAAARFTGKNRSRPASQAGEGRISLTMSRLGGLMRSSKEPLRQSEDGSEINIGPALTVVAPTNVSVTTTSLGVSGASVGVSVPSNVSLTSTNTADQLVPVALDNDGSDQQQQQSSRKSEDGRAHQHQHSHSLSGHGHGHHHRRSKLSRAERESDDTAEACFLEGVGPTSGKGKEKEKDRTKNKGNVPERECLLM